VLDNGRSHPAQNLIRAVRPPVLYPVNPLPHDREERLNEVGGRQTLALCTADAETMERDNSSPTSSMEAAASEERPAIPAGRPIPGAHPQSVLILMSFFIRQCSVQLTAAWAATGRLHWGQGHAAASALRDSAAPPAPQSGSRSAPAVTLTLHRRVAPAWFGLFPLLL